MKERKTMNLEQYENLILLLKKALEFYANENNYVNKKNNIAMIDADKHGSQARFVLKKIEEFNGINDEIDKEFQRQLNNCIEMNKSYDEIMNIINHYKNISENEN